VLEFEGNGVPVNTKRKQSFPVNTTALKQSFKILGSRKKILQKLNIYVDMRNAAIFFNLLQSSFKLAQLRHINKTKFQDVPVKATKAYRGRRYNFVRSQPRLDFEVTGQTLAPAELLPNKNPGDH
jgi:hypothetical protein